jgi:hypothetical protein
MLMMLEKLIADGYLQLKEEIKYSLKIESDENSHRKLNLKR